MLPLFRAVVVWAVILAAVVVPRLDAPAVVSHAAVAVTQLSAYDRLSVVQNTRHERVQAALAEVRTLQGFLPICSYCKSIRDDQDYWATVETYISKHTNTQFTHSICPACYRNVIEPGFKTRERE